MQNQVINERVDIEYTPFEVISGARQLDCVLEYNAPPLQPIDSLHYHDALELGCCKSGSGVFWIDGAQFPFSKGCVSVIWPGQLHKARSTGQQPSYWAFVTVKQEQIGEPLSGSVSSDPALTSLIGELVRECERRQPDYLTCVQGLLCAILVKYRRATVSAGSAEHRRHMERLRGVVDYISEHYAEELTVRGLSRTFFVHESTLRSWFQTALGINPMTYVHQTRITTACALLKDTQTPVNTVAEQVGYQTLSTFNRNFQAICGCSPREYRRGADAGGEADGKININPKTLT